MKVCIVIIFIIFSSLNAMRYDTEQLVCEESEMIKIVNKFNDGDERLLDNFLQKGRSLSKEHEYASQLLYNAVFYQENCDRVVKKLLTEYNADPNIKDHEGYSPLYRIVIAKNCLNVLEILLINKGDVNIQTNRGTSLLHAAVTIDCNYVKFLMSSNALPNVKNRAGDTPLHNATEKKCKTCIKLLLDHGADPEIENEEGKSSFDIALEQKDSEIMLLCNEVPKIKIKTNLKARLQNFFITSKSDNNMYYLAQLQRK